jgi:hypothetical protein
MLFLFVAVLVNALMQTIPLIGLSGRGTIRWIEWRRADMRESYARFGLADSLLLEDLWELGQRSD